MSIKIINKLDMFKLNKSLKLITIFILFNCLLMIQITSFAESEKQVRKITPSELQSQIMSFADVFIGDVTGASIEYLVNNPLITAKQRALVTGRSLESISAAIRIAAGPNPEVALLDMVVLVSLLHYATEMYILPKISGSNKKIFLTIYESLEKNIWLIANKVLSKEQKIELQGLIETWKSENKLEFGIPYYRFSNFSKNRKISTLVDEGNPGWFLANISEAKKELERTRVFAERVVFSAERQPTIIRLQVEQIFYDLAIFPEFQALMKSTIDISKASLRIASALNKMPKQISSGSDVIINTLMTNIKQEREEMIVQLFQEISKERNATIDQAAKQFVDKFFYSATLLIFVFMICALLTLLTYRFFSSKMKN